MASDSPTAVPSQSSVKAFVEGKILDEDDFASNSATKVPTQQSAKAFVDSRVVDTRSFSGANDAAIINAAITFAEASGIGTVKVHKKTVWEITSQINCGSTRVVAASRGQHVKVTGSMTTSAVFNQGSTGVGGGVSGFKIEAAYLAAYGVRIQGADFVVEDCEVLQSVLEDGEFGVPNQGYIGIEVTATAVRPVVRWNRVHDCSTNVRISASATDVDVYGNTITRYYIKGINILETASPVGPWKIRGNTWGAPAVYMGVGKQPFAVNNSSGNTTLPKGLIIEHNWLFLPGGGFDSGDENDASADAISGHGVSDAVIRFNYVYGSGELGITLSLGGNRNVIEHNYVENCDVGGISLGVAADSSTSMTGNKVINNTVVNAAKDVLGLHSNFANYYHTYQDAMVSLGNKSIITDGVTEYDERWDNCTNIVADDPGTNLGGTGTRYLSGTTAANFLTLPKRRVRWGVSASGAGTEASGSNENVTSVAKNSTGKYTITLAKALPDTDWPVHANLLGTSAGLIIPNVTSTTTVEIYTFNTSFAATDRAFCFSAVQ